MTFVKECETFFKETISIQINNKLEPISSIFDKCSMLLQAQSQPNHTSCINFYFNEFVANVFRDNMGSKIIQPPTSKKKCRFFDFFFSNWDFDLEISHLRKKVFMPTSKM